jgi:hypothetical protein
MDILLQKSWTLNLRFKPVDSHNNEAWKFFIYILYEL